MDSLQTTALRQEPQNELKYPAILLENVIKDQNEFLPYTFVISVTSKRLMPNFQDAPLRSVNLKISNPRDSDL